MNSQMVIPSQLLGKLKCAQCLGFLSCGPVLKLHSGLTVCGRCATSQEEPSNRCEEFEALASLVHFPCNNREAGCSENLSFSLKGQPHESECPHRPYVCPVAGPETCEWMGTRADILDHCRTHHPQQVVTNPHILEHDIRRSCQSTLLLLVGHLLFLLHTKVCLTSKKIFHAVRYLGDPQRVAQFTYFVKVVRGSESVNKSRQVAPEGYRALQEDSSIALEINALLSILGGFDGTSFTVRVDGDEGEEEMVKCAKGCGRDASARVYHNDEEEGKGWWCEVCTPERAKCRNSENGCTYTDYSVKCIKHELYHCKFCTRCIPSGCSETLLPGTLYQHWSMKHNTVATYASGVLWRCKPSTDRQRCFIKYDEGTAFCNYWIENSYFKLYVFSDLPSEQLKKYSCLVEFSNSETKRIVSEELNTNYNARHDWFVSMDSKFHQCVNRDFNIKLIIRRIYMHVRV